MEISRENAMEPVFITQPMVFGDGIDPVTGIDLARAGVNGPNGRVLWRQLELYNDVVRKTASQHGVLLIDLAGEMPKSSEFFYDTYHFTNAGCAAVAEIIDKRLEPFLEKKFPNYSFAGLP
jgi:hypothetical protein